MPKFKTIRKRGVPTRTDLLRGENDPTFSVPRKYDYKAQTVYEVVAGRPPDSMLLDRLRDLGTHGFSNHHRHYRNYPSIHAPDDVLITDPAAPEEGIPVIHHVDLPDSDLLKALHYYVSEYYNAANLPKMFGALDETSLLALGVLIEEEIAQMLGPDGHLAYAEEKEEDGDEDEDEEEDEEQVEEEEEEDEDEDEEEEEGYDDDQE